MSGIISTVLTVLTVVAVVALVATMIPWRAIVGWVVDHWLSAIIVASILFVVMFLVIIPTGIVLLAIFASKWWWIAFAAWIVLAVAVAWLLVVWAWRCIRIVPKNAVAVRVNGGEPEVDEDLPPLDGELAAKILPSGWYVVPALPKIGGYKPFDLEILQTDTHTISYQEDEIENFWAKSDIEGNPPVQVAAKGINVQIDLPYEDGYSVLRLIKAGVHTSREGLKKWIEDPLVSAMKKPIGQKDYIFWLQSAESESFNLNAEVNEDIRSKDPPSPFVRAGFFGTDPDDDSPGTGYIRVAIEQIDVVDEELRKAHHKVAVASREAQAAKKTAEAQVELASVPVRALAAAGEKDKAAAERLILARDGHYSKKEDKLEVDVTSAGKPIEPLAAWLTGLVESVFASKNRDRGGEGSSRDGGSGKRRKRGGGKKGDDDSPPRKKASEMTAEERKREIADM